MTDQMIRLEYGFLAWRHAPGDTVEIVNIEVDNRFRRTGIGRRLIRELFTAVEGRRVTCYAFTRSDNMIAQQFYERCGFDGHPIRNFYGGHGVDAVLYCHKGGHS